MNWSSVQSYSVVMAGGALGSALRLWMSSVVASRLGESFPWGTFMVNVAGCFAIGLYAGWAGASAPPLARQFVTIGVLGGFTTFSSFGLQTYELLTAGEWSRAALNAFGSLILCVLAVWMGVALAHSINAK